MLASAIEAGARSLILARRSRLLHLAAMGEGLIVPHLKGRSRLARRARGSRGNAVVRLPVFGHD